jgi:hypothetical protein
MTEQANREIILEIWARDRNDLIASFSWANGATTITFAKEDLSHELQKFIDQGLSEWIGPDDDAKPRVTLSGDAFFLPNLGAYIQKQSGMRAKISWEGRQ